MKLLKFGIRFWITITSVLSFLTGWIMLAHAPKPNQARLILFLVLILMIIISKTSLCSAYNQTLVLSSGHPSEQVDHDPLN